MSDGEQAPPVDDSERVDLFGGGYPDAVAIFFAALVKRLGYQVTITQEDLQSVAGHFITPMLKLDDESWTFVLVPPKEQRN